MSGDTLIGTAAGAESTICHVCWQAAVGREFFAQTLLYGRVRERLIRAHGKPGRQLLHYVLLPTEIHVLAQLPAGESAGDLARSIGNVVSRWVRQSQPFRSPVLAGPYRAHVIGTTDELLADVRMLSWRAVRMGACKSPNQYPHSALRYALGLSPVQGFDSRCVLRLFGTTVPTARAALRAWVARPPTELEWREWDLTRGLSLALGSVGPHQQMAREVRAVGAAALVAAGGDGIDGALRLLETWVAFQLALRAPPRVCGRQASVSARGRALVACLAVKHQLCSASAVARHFGRAKATLSEQMAVCRTCQVDRTIIATAARRIVEEVATRPQRDGPARQHRLT